MESYKVIIKPSALKELGDIPKKFLEKITRRMFYLEKEPRPMGCEKPSVQEQYRLRQGDYRIVYEIDDPKRTVYVVKVAHRRNVYR